MVDGCLIIVKHSYLFYSNNPITPMNGDQYSPSFLDKVAIFLKGSIKVGKRVKPGWKEPTMFYGFKCPIHGYVVSVEHTNGLYCPLCIEDAHKGILYEKRNKVREFNLIDYPFV